MALELYVTPGCPFCADLRAELECDGLAFIEHDVTTDAAARARLRTLAGPSAMVPVLVEDGRIRQVGVAGRGCYVGSV